MAPPTLNAVHRYFVYDKTTNTSTCELCSNKLKGKHSTNLKNHLQAKHSNEYKVVEDLNSKAVQPNRSSKNNIEILKKLCVRLVTVHGRPLAMMEDEAFQTIINLAAGSDDASKNINIKAIKIKILEEAEEVRRKISEETKNKMISLKIDAATCLERKFLGINVQYILNAKLVVRNLAVVEVHNKQTSSFLKTTIEQILTDFNISPSQLYCICTDNGSNMVKMVKMMGGSYISDNYNSGDEEDDLDDAEESDDEILQDELFENNIFNSFDVQIENFIANDRNFKIRGMLCAAHTLQLAVKDAIASDINVQATLKIARIIVNILRKPNNMNILKQANLNKPIKDCATRWTSTYNMLMRLITLQDFCGSVAEILTLVSEGFWQEIKVIVNCLKPVNEATIILQKQQLTIGDFYITWLNCKSHIETIEASFAVALHFSMIQREIKLMENDVVLEGLYLDSRLNVLLSPEQCQKAKKLLKEVYLQHNCLKNQDLVDSTERPGADTEVIPSTSTNTSAVEAMLQSRERERRSSIVLQNTSFEMSLNELCFAPRLNLTENIIMHWQNKAIITSELASVANIVLGAPATQVSVERLFSSLKFVLHPLRNRISPLFLKDIMILRENKDLIGN